MVHALLIFGAAVVVLLLTVTVGVPAALRLAQPHVWRPGRPEPDLGRAGFGPAGPSFEPLDLGPDPMRWPSEIPWPAVARPEPPWPSQTWDDPHFGQHWRTHSSSGRSDAAFEAALEARRQRAADNRAREADRRARKPQKQADKEQTAIERRARQEMREMRDRAAKLQSEATAATGRAVEELKKAPKKAAGAAGDRARQAAAEQARRAIESVPGVVPGTVPSPAELEQLVAQVGLAGTVQVIMERTGWDFKTAAQHLAKARRGR